MPSLPTQIGRYEVRDRLGVGGMGVVYLATDPRLRRTVAIKVLSSVGGEAGNEELRERFAREARSVAALKHNNIVTIYDIGEDQGRPFIAMEFLDGETLGEMIRRRAQLTVSRKLQLMGELCAGLGYAHRNGIVHRDIKPANLMITAEGTLKILDFGLARVTAELTSAGLTRHGALMGTPFYMSPEQIDGTPIDHRSDIFSVGLVLYELLAFRKAFPGDSSPVVLHNIIHREPAAIRDLLPGIDPDLERVVARGLEKDRARRYQHLPELASDLERIRSRIEDGPDDTLIATRVVSEPEQTPPRLEGSGGPTPRSGSRSIPNLGAIAERRAAQIEAHLAAAAGHLEGGRFDEVIEQCEHALVLNPQEHRALEMLEQAHRGNEDRRVAGWLDEARGQLSREALTGAEALVDQTLVLRPELPDALDLRRQIRDRRREKELAAERDRALQMALQRTRANLDAGALEAALRTASETLAYDPDHPEARALREQIQAAIDARRRGQEREREQAAREAVARRAEEERGRAEDERRRDAELFLERTRTRLSEPEPPRPDRDQGRAAEPVRRQVPARAIAAAAIGVLLLAVGAVFFFGSGGSPPPPDPDVAARTTIETAATLYADGQITEAISLLRSVQPPHALVTQQLNDWEGESGARAAAVVAEARKMFDTGQRAEAIDRLTTFQPSHPTVSAALAELRDAWGRGQVTAEIEQRVKAAQEFQRRGQDRNALREAQVGLALNPDHPELMTIKRVIMDGAAGRAEDARRQAMKVPGASARDEYQTGVADERRAQSMRDDQPDQALTLYATAAQRFAAARSQQALANSNRDELLKWEATRRGDLAGAMKQRRWDEAERIEKEIRAKAPGASGLDEARAQIAQGRQADAAAMNKPPAAGGAPNAGTGGGTTGRGTPGGGTPGRGTTPAETSGGGAGDARALIARQIFEAIDRFDAAVESRRTEAVSQAWPKMAREARQYFEDLFRRQNRIVWEFPTRDVNRIKSTGDSVAEVEIPVRAEMIGIRNEKTVREEVWRFKLTGAANGWSIEDASRVKEE